MKTPIGIFQGKQTKNNKFLLKTLYETGPLTAWELTKKSGEPKKPYSLYSIYFKRLKNLEKKDYVQHIAKRWTLQFKGIMAVLIIQSEPKPWNPKWTTIFERYTKNMRNSSKKYAITEDGKEIADLKKTAQITSINLRDFESWVFLSNWIKDKMEEGFVNFDLIKNRSLLAMILAEFSDISLENAMANFGIKKGGF